MIDIKQLQDRCEMPWEEYEGVVWSVDKPSYRHYRYIDNGKGVLAIAHLDYVGPNLTFGTMWHSGRQKAFHGGMDDRLGAYIILDLLPSMLGEMPYDVLLTDGEEHGQSTASIFVPSHKYNWMFEFDREGLDATMYDYGSREWDEILRTYGWNPVRGTASDISKMYDLGYRGFNFGNGNHLGHSEWNYADLVEVQTTAQWFAKFWGDWKDKELPFDQAVDRRKDFAVTYWKGGEWQPSAYETSFYGMRQDDGYATGLGGVKKHKHGNKKKGELLVEPCEECGEEEELDPNYFLCQTCRDRWAALGHVRPSYKFRTKKGGTDGQEPAGTAQEV